jgi:hypothetical protein
LPRALAGIGGCTRGIGGGGSGVHGDVDRGGGVSGGAGRVGSGKMSVRKRGTSGSVGGEGGCPGNWDRRIRTRRLDGLPGAIIGRTDALEDGQYSLCTVGSEANGLNLGQRPDLQPHLAVKQWLR